MYQGDIRMFLHPEIARKVEEKMAARKKSGE